MKLVFFVVGMCYMLGLLIAMIAGFNVVVFLLPAICIISVLCAVFYKKENKTAVLTGLLCICGGILLYSAAYHINVLPTEALDDQSGSVLAQITGQASSNGKYTYYINTSEITLNDKAVENVPQNIKLRITSRYDLDLEENDIVRLNTVFTKKNSSPYDFHDISNGFYINASLSDNNISLYGKEEPKLNPIGDFKSEISSKIKELLGGNQGKLLISLLLGDKDELGGNIKESFRSSGLSHILVVSGLHLSIIIGFIFSLFSLFIKNRKMSAAITIIFILFYTVLTGGGYSILRAAIMSIIFLLAILLSQNTDSLNSLGLAGLLITLQNPLAIGNLSLLMSFSATLGICTLGKRLDEIITARLAINKKGVVHRILYLALRYILETSAISVSAVLFTMPVMVFVFEQFNTYFLLSNLLIAFVAPLVIAVGIIMLIISYIPLLNILVNIIAVIEELLCSYVLGVSSAVSKLPLATINLDSILIKLAALAVILVVAVFYIVQGFKVKSIVSCTAISLAVVIIIFTGRYAVMTQSVCFEVIKTGSGVTIAEHSNSGTNLICCGGSYYYFDNVANSIDGSKINNVIIPDKHSYYSKYAEDIFAEFDVGRVFAYNSDDYTDDLLNALSKQNCEFLDENTDINFNGYNVKIIPTQHNNWIYITVGNSSILVSPKNGDFSQLPQEYRNSSVAILESGCKHIDLLNCKNTLYCGKSDSGYCTSNGDIILFKPSANDITIWQ